LSLACRSQHCWPLLPTPSKVPFIAVVCAKNTSIAATCSSTFITATGYNFGTAAGASTSTSTICSEKRAQTSSTHAGQAILPTRLQVPLPQSPPLGQNIHHWCQANFPSLPLLQVPLPPSAVQKLQYCCWCQ